jgi:hypothetical protein
LSPQRREQEFRNEVILSFNRALVGEVLPELIGVTISWTNGQIRAVFYYDRPLDDDLIENCEEIETEVLADFEGIDIDVQPVWAPEKSALQPLQLWVFLRKQSED